MVKRHSKSAFMANAMVFPGGRVDEADADPRWAKRCMGAASNISEDGHQQTDNIRALQIAAIRETYEEAGVLLAQHGEDDIDPNSPTGQALFGEERASLNAGTVDFLDIAERYDLKLDLSALLYFTRWVTPEIESRRFDARFFAARLPAMQTPLHDRMETTEGVWLAPDDALLKYDAEQIQLAPPTLRILLEVAADWTTLERSADGARVPMAPQPHFEDGQLHLLLPGDERYEPPGSAKNRIVMEKGRCISIGRGA